MAIISILLFITSIFKLPSSSTIIHQKVIKDDVRLPTLDKKRNGEEADSFNPEKRRVVKIPL